MSHRNDGRHQLGTGGRASERNEAATHRHHVLCDVRGVAGFIGSRATEDRSRNATPSGPPTRPPSRPAARPRRSSSPNAGPAAQPPPLRRPQPLHRPRLRRERPPRRRPGRPRAPISSRLRTWPRPTARATRSCGQTSVPRSIISRGRNITARPRAAPIFVRRMRRRPASEPPRTRNIPELIGTSLPTERQESVDDEDGCDPQFHRLVFLAL